MSTRVHVYTTSQLCTRLRKISLDQSHAKWIFAVSMLTVGLNTYLASRCNLCVLRRLLIHRKKKSTSYIKRIVILFFLQKSINSIIHENIQDWKELHVSIILSPKLIHTSKKSTLKPEFLKLILFFELYAGRRTFFPFGNLVKIKIEIYNENENTLYTRDLDW